MTSTQHRQSHSSTTRPPANLDHTTTRPPRLHHHTLTSTTRPLAHLDHTYNHTPTSTTRPLAHLDHTTNRPPQRHHHAPTGGSRSSQIALWRRKSPFEQKNKISGSKVRKVRFPLKSQKRAIFHGIHQKVHFWRKRRESAPGAPRGVPGDPGGGRIEPRCY